MPAIRLLLTALVVGLAACAALAQPAATHWPPPRDVLNLQASASVEVPRDWLVLTFTAHREGVDAVSVQADLKRALDAALAEARRVARPGHIEVATGHFSLWPRLGPHGVVVGWHGSAELIVQGRDLDGMARLPERIKTMAVAAVALQLSREVQRRAEAEAVERAVERFRLQARDIARLFDHRHYTLREVTVTVGVDAPHPPPTLRAEAMAAPAEAPLPIEPGRATVTATVSGSVHMRMR